LDTYDSRLKRLSCQPHFILINNYKCGFSSSNLLPHEGVCTISPDDQVIFFYRDISLRAISVFINWCITDDRYVHESGWLLNNLKAELPNVRYSELLDLLFSQRYTEAFRIYVETLETIANQNNHTAPQITLLEHYALDKIDYFIELENSADFYQLTNIHFPHDQKNKSNLTIKHALIKYLTNNKSLQQELNKIYRDDLAFFGANDLTCIRWQDIG